MEPSRQQQIEWGAHTDRGVVREQNQDSFAVDLEKGVVVVSDGIGGGNGGGTASEIVAKMLPQMIASRIRDASTKSHEGLRSALQSAVCDLSDQLHARTNGCPSARGMGATVVAIVIRDARIHIAHMGDSRAYLIRDGQMKRLTDDHSVVGILERRHEISAQEARIHVARGRLTRFVGMPMPALPDVSTMPIQKGDRILLCTDGLTGMVDDKAIEAIVCNTPQPQEACERLVDAALAGGGEDNITAVVVNC